MVIVRRDILIVDCPFMRLLLLWSGLCSGMCAATHKTDASPSSPRSGNIMGKLLYYAQRGIREKHKSNKVLGGK